MTEKPYITQMSMDGQTVAVSKDLFDYVLLVAWDSVLQDYWQEEAVDWLGLELDEMEMEYLKVVTKYINTL